MISVVSVADVLKAISDKKSLELFRIVALVNGTDVLISKIKLTRKQYYSRISRLVNAGLIKRKNGKYTLTAFGKVIYYAALTIIENATNSYWKLKVIDSLEMSNDISAEEHKKIIDNLIDDREIKDALVSINGKFESTRPCAAELLQQKQTHQLRQSIVI
jgi:predicted transcriptional regulator